MNAGYEHGQLERLRVDLLRDVRMSVGKEIAALRRDIGEALAEAHEIGARDQRTAAGLPEPVTGGPRRGHLRLVHSRSAS